MSFIFSLNPIFQALLATIFTWSITALGSSFIFFFKKINKSFLDYLLGLSVGIMFASSIWSLLLPAIEMANTLNLNTLLIISLGFLAGVLLLFISDKITELNKDNKAKRILMLIISIVLHNIPEGLAIGISFGSILYGLSGSSLVSAWFLTLGIGIQNFPEGLSISLPLRREGYSLKKSFFLGQLTGFVEPIAGVLGALIVLKIRLLLPFLLSFSAGSMIYVVICELIPESQKNKNKSLMTLITLIGFVIMMILEILFN